MSPIWQIPFKSRDRLLMVNVFVQIKNVFVQIENVFVTGSQFGEGIPAILSAV